MSFLDINTQAPDKSLKGKLFIGEVVNNNDPLHLDRIQVRVPELYEPSENEVPWCMPLKNPVFGQGSGFGMYGVPAVGALVVIECQHGDDSFPVYRGCVQTKANVNAEYDTPDKYGFVDPSSNKLLVDMKAQTWTFTHSSGTIIELNKDGRVYVKCKDALTECETSTISASKSATVNTETSTVNATTANVKCTTANTECSTFKVKANTSTFDCPTNNFAGLVNCKSITTGYGGGAGTATLQNVKVSSSLNAGGVELIGHTHTAQGEYGETTGPH